MSLVERRLYTRWCRSQQIGQSVRVKKLCFCCREIAIFWYFVWVWKNHTLNYFTPYSYVVCISISDLFPGYFCSLVVLCFSAKSFTRQHDYMSFFSCFLVIPGSDRPIDMRTIWWRRMVRGKNSVTGLLHIWNKCGVFPNSCIIIMHLNKIS